ncbi:MAG: methionyl-tRNA formyltransferase [Minisyncoccia bacterium]
MKNENVKIAFWGSSNFSLIVLKELKKLAIFPSILVTTPDKPQGRRMVLTPTPVKVWGEENSIECLTPEKLKEESFVKKISEYNLFIVASYGKIIPNIILDIPTYKVLNIHPSLLPKYRGPSPLQTQILSGDKEVGVSIMQIDEEVDHGPIIIQKEIVLEKFLGFNELEEKMAKVGAELLAETLPLWIKGKIKATPQNHADASFTKKIEKGDGLIDIQNGNQLENYLKILAFENWPVAFFEINRNNKKIKVLIKQADFDEQKINILRVVPEGKNEMNYKDFLRGSK